MERAELHGTSSNFTDLKVRDEQSIAVIDHQHRVDSLDSS